MYIQNTKLIKQILQISVSWHHKKSGREMLVSQHGIGVPALTRLTRGPGLEIYVHPCLVREVQLKTRVLGVSLMRL